MPGSLARVNSNIGRGKGAERAAGSLVHGWRRDLPSPGAAVIASPYAPARDELRHVAFGHLCLQE